MGYGQRWNPAKFAALVELYGTAEVFADRIRENLAARGDDPARARGLSGRTIRRWMAGDVEPTLSLLYVLADATGIDLGELLEPKDPGQPERRKPGRPRKNGGAEKKSLTPPTARR